MLFAVVALAVLREGSEIVLFLYGMAAGGAGVGGLVSGIPLGIAGGVAVGFALYFGLLRIPLRDFCTATNGLLVLLAAGLASTGARFLLQANLLPAWGNQIWNTSDLLSNGSVIGQALHILVGYDAHPAGIQMAFWAAVVMLLLVGMRMSTRPAQRAAPATVESNRSTA
jgi:high-affinity iron transporter